MDDDNRKDAVSREKKLSLQEQMLQDALAASASSANSATTAASLSSSSLLDCNLTGHGDVFHKVSNIVRQKTSASQELEDMDQGSVSSQAQNLVVELD